MSTNKLLAPLTYFGIVRFNDRNKLSAYESAFKLLQKEKPEWKTSGEVSNDSSHSKNDCAVSFKVTPRPGDGINDAQGLYTFLTQFLCTKVGVRHEGAVIPNDMTGMQIYLVTGAF